MSKLIDFATSVGEDIKNVNIDIVDLNKEVYSPQNGQRYISPITYWYPDFNKTTSKWNQAVSVKDSLGFVIINPSSGVGTVKDDMYAKQTVRARAVGARVLGYVPTGYGNFELEEVKRQIRQYQEWYGIAGVFLDEFINGFSQQEALIPKYQELSSELRKEFGQAFTIVANPGSNVAKELLDTADVFMNFESSAEKYVDGSRTITPDYCLSENANKFWHVIYGVTKDNYQSVIAKLDKEHVGHVYLVDNPPEGSQYGNPASAWLQEAMEDWAHCRTDLVKRVDTIEKMGMGEVSTIQLATYKIPDEYFPTSFKGKVTAKMAVYGNAVDISIKVNEYIGSSTETDKDEATETWPSGLLDYAGNLTVPFTKYSSKQGYAPFLVVNASGKLTFRGSGMDANGSCFGHINYLATNPTIPSGWTKLN